ncbi:hypothetical protein FRB99_005766 [Tulasnella sp. 403]|nr:hypothetical protein FRB99_005766 [Tulasnella sp. 403]
MLLAIPCALALYASGAIAESLNVYHRLLVPDDRITPFSTRGTIEVSDATGLVFRPAESATRELKTWLAQTQDNPASFEQGFYQLAVQLRKQDGPEDWVFQSVRWCHVPISTTDVISLQKASDSGYYAFDYYVAPVPRDGSCPSGQAGNVANVLSNTTVALRDVNYPPVTILRRPVLLSETGEPIKPPVEKTFWQKYWVYIIGGVLVLLLAAPEPEDMQNRQRPAAR